MHEVTGLDINTIRRGRRELADDLVDCPLTASERWGVDENRWKKNCEPRVYAEQFGGGGNRRRPMRSVQVGAPESASSQSEAGRYRGAHQSCQYCSFAEATEVLPQGQSQGHCPHSASPTKPAVSLHPASQTAFHSGRASRHQRGYQEEGIDWQL
jgi:ribosomal protein L32